MLQVGTGEARNDNVKDGDEAARFYMGYTVEAVANCGIVLQSHLSQKKKWKEG